MFELEIIFSQSRLWRKPKNSVVCAHVTNFTQLCVLNTRNRATYRNACMLYRSVGARVRVAGGAGHGIANSCKYRPYDTSYGWS